MWDDADAGSITAGAAARRAGAGGLILTSRVGVLKDRLDIQPSERPTQVASATLVRIFISGYPRFLIEGCAPELRGRRRWVVYVVANPGAPFKTILKVNCAIAVPRVENENPLRIKLPRFDRASGLRKFCISFPPRDFRR